MIRHCPPCSLLVVVGAACALGLPACVRDAPVGPGPSISTIAEARCGDGRDNDGDGAADCADPDCEATPACLPATIFVSTSGSDSLGDGSADRPLRTIGKAASIAGPADVIEVASGTYREMAMVSRGGSDGAPIVIRGNGAVVEGAEPIAGPWEPEIGPASGQCVLWSTAFDPAEQPDLALDATHYAPTQLFLDGARLTTLPLPEEGKELNALTPDETQDDARIAAQLAPDTWFWLDASPMEPASTWRPLRIYVCLAPGDSPSGHVIEVPVRNAGLVIAASHLHVRGFDVRRQAACGICVQGDQSTTGVEIEENRVSYVAALRKNRPGDMEGKNVWEEGVGIALRVGRGATARYNRVSHTSYTGIRLLKLGEPGACTIAITENEIEDIEPHPFGSGNGHEHGQGIAGGMFSAGATIEGNQVARVAFGVWLDSSYGGACGASKALVSRNRIEDVRKGIFFERSTRECVAMRNVVLRADVGISLGTREQYAQEQLSGAPHDTCWGGDGEGVFSSAGHRVLHNTVVDAEQGIALGYALAPDVRDNIVSGHGATGIVVTDATLQAHADAGTALGPVDYNLYDVPSGLVGRWLESDCPSLETWQQASGTALDSHSLIGGPKFVSPDTGDFALQPSSPARDAGVDVGVGGACGKPDIGAIELTAPCQ